MMIRKFIFIFVVVVLAGFVALVIIKGQNTCAKKDTPDITADEDGLERPVPVVCEIIGAGTFEEYLSTNGIVEAWNRTTVSSETGGRVEKWHAEIGDWLNSGDVIVEFNAEVAVLNFEQAKAALETAEIAGEKAEKDFNRQKVLHSNGDLSDNMFEAAELQYRNTNVALKAAMAAAGLAERTLEETRIKMPFNGRLSSRYAAIGQSIPPGAPIVEVVQLDKLKIKSGVSEVDIMNVAIGQDVLLTTPAWEERTFNAKVHAVGPASDVLNRLFPVVIKIINNSGDLKPGMAATARILLKKYDNALTIPRETLFTAQDGYTCYAVKDDKAVLKSISVTALSSTRAMIRRGLVSDDTIVVVGMSSLRDGQRLDISIQ